MIIIVCSSSDSEGDAAKLREFENMQRLHRQQIEDNLLEDSPSLTFSGRRSQQGPQPLLSVLLCSLPVSSAVGYAPRTFAGPSAATPNSWACSAGPQVGLSPFPTRMPSSQGPQAQVLIFPVPFPSSRLPRTGGSVLPPGGLLCQRPTGYQNHPSIGSPSCPNHSFPWSSTTVDTSPSASVGFLAAGGTPNTGTLRHTRAVPSWSSGSPDSPRLTPGQTPSNIATGLVRLPVRPLVSPPTVRYRSTCPQPCPRSRRASDSETFVSPVSVHFSKEEIGLVGRQENRDRSPVRTGVYSEWREICSSFKPLRLTIKFRLTARAVSIACAWFFSVNSLKEICLLFHTIIKFFNVFFFVRGFCLFISFSVYMLYTILILCYFLRLFFIIFHSRSIISGEVWYCVSLLCSLSTTFSRLYLWRTCMILPPISRWIKHSTKLRLDLRITNRSGDLKTDQDASHMLASTWET